MASVPSEDFVKFCNANAMMKKPLKLLPIAHSMLSVVHAECREQCFLDLKGIDLLLRIVDAHIPEHYIKGASACMEGLAVSGTHEYVDLVLPPAMEQQEKVNIVERMFKMRAELAVLAATELVDIEELQNVPGLACTKTLMDKIVPADVSLPTPNRHALWKEMLACTSAPNVQTSIDETLGKFNAVVAAEPSIALTPVQSNSKALPDPTPLQQQPACAIPQQLALADVYAFKAEGRRVSK